MTIRPATSADLDVLVPLFDAYRQFYRKAHDLEAARTFLSARFQHRESTVFLAFDGDVAAGFTQLYPSFSSVSLGRIFVLNDLYVDVNHRQKGIGSQLLTTAIEFARSAGAVRLTLQTAVTNATAQSVYEAGGWVRDEVYYVYNFALQ